MLGKRRENPEAGGQDEGPGGFFTGLYYVEMGGKGSRDPGT